jgi:hypothetical protein
MIYLFRIISDENQEFYRDLVIDGSDTFLDFHRVLQEDLNYDPALLASFFITNDKWEKQQEITLIDMMQDPSVLVVTMDQVTLDEYITEENQRMIYMFDFFSERAFFIELLEISDQVSPRETPFVGHASGDPPRQLSFDQLLDDSKDDDLFQGEDDEFYGWDDLGPDELGPDGLGPDDMDPDFFDEELPEEY